MSLPDPYPIDLHGLRPEAAMSRLRQGLHAARSSGAAQALVITGRGMGNRTQTPVLRTKVEAWLGSPAARPFGVSRFQRVSGGGALLVPLR
jgi:DNA-nicking Smr family endonuclease